MKYTSFVPAVIVLAALLVLGFLLFGYPRAVDGYTGESVANFGTYAKGLFASGLFSAGLFSVGVFSVGVFSIGIFSIGVFSIGVFSLGVWTIGFFMLGAYRKRRLDRRNREASV